jgi:hypothetical protein
MKPNTSKPLTSAKPKPALKPKPRVLSVILGLLVALMLNTSCKTNSMSMQHTHPTQDAESMHAEMVFNVKSNAGCDVAGTPIIITKLDGTIVATGLTDGFGRCLTEVRLTETQSLIARAVVHGVECVKHLGETSLTEPVVFDGNGLELDFDAIDVEKLMAYPLLNKINQTLGLRTSAPDKQDMNLPVSYSSEVFNILSEEHVEQAEWQDIETLRDDAYSKAIEIGFPFPFYNQTYQKLYIASNGFIGFEPSLCYNLPLNMPIGTTLNNDCNAGQQAAAPRGIIAWCWDDLKPGPDTQIGISRSQKAISIMFKGFTRVGSSAPISAVLTLNEFGDIDIYYTRVDKAFETRSCTVGLQDKELTYGLQTAYNQPFIKEHMGISYRQENIEERVVTTMELGFNQP